MQIDSGGCSSVSSLRAHPTVFNTVIITSLIMHYVDRITDINRNYLPA